MKAQDINIGQFAQPCLATISPMAPAKVALSVMRKAGIHYLPVQDGDEVVGLLADNRLRSALAFHRKDNPLVSDLMIREPAVVSPETSLFQVLDETPEATHGFTVVQDDSGEVTGVFTPNDAVLAFRGLLKTAKKPMRDVA